MLASQELVRVSDLSKHYLSRAGLFAGGGKKVRAVDGVSFTIQKNQVFALVGESGCGKSTLARLLLSLEKPTSGSICFDGRDLASLGSRDRRWYRSSVQLVMQDPFSSLNPRLRVESIVGEPLEVNRRASARERRRLIDEMLEFVGLDSSSRRLFPHEFSGGQRQRIALARALILRPQMVVLDEPVSSLDVSIRAQILNLLEDIRLKFGLSYLLISHDLAVVRHVADVTAVMYLGRIVEIGPTESLFLSPKHPYTRALLDAVPDPFRNRAVRKLVGEPGSAIETSTGCRFHPRCPLAVEQCREQEPELLPVAGEHFSACYMKDHPSLGDGLGPRAPPSALNASN